MTDAEKDKFYDDVLAPALLEVQKKCQEAEIPFIAVAFIKPGEWGETAFIPTDCQQAHIRTVQAAIEDSKSRWNKGFPEKPWSEEWFMAVTSWGDRVALIALPEEYGYDFKTSDGTYFTKEVIAKWMPFPDSDYVVPPSPEKEQVI